MLDLEDNHDWGGRVDTPDGPYYHQQACSKVLGVAHLDTVMNARPIKTASLSAARSLTTDSASIACLIGCPVWAFNLTCC